MAFRAVYSASNCLRKNPRYIWRLDNWRGLSSTARVSDIFNIQDEADFKEKVLKSTKPVVVDFHATWCGPCKLLMPRLETIVGSTKDAVDLAKVDIDELSEIAMEYAVEAVPSVISFKDGKVRDKFVGLKDNDEIEKFVAALRK